MRIFLAFVVVWLLLVSLAPMSSSSDKLSAAAPMRSPAAPTPSPTVPSSSLENRKRGEGKSHENGRDLQRLWNRHCE